MYRIEYDVISDALCHQIISVLNPDSVQQFKGYKSLIFSTHTSVYISKAITKCLKLIEDGWRPAWLTYAEMTPGPGLVKHIDIVPDGVIAEGAPLSESIITFVMYLNDEFVGGELVVDGNDAYKPSAGSVVVFNGGRDAHQVLPIFEGHRHTLTLWCIPNKKA